MIHRLFGMVGVHSFLGLRCSLLIAYCVLCVHLTHGQGLIQLPSFCGLTSCFSSENAFHTCQLGDEITIKNVTIFYRVSDSECRYFGGYPGDYNGIDGVYGFSNNALWVDHGCRAYFRFCYIPGPSTICGVTSCFSWNYAFKSCKQRDGIRIKNATTLSRFSDSVCTFFDGLPEDYNGVDGVYGYNNNVLWVDHGCRAHFSFCYIETSQPTKSAAPPLGTSTSAVFHRTTAKSGTSTRPSIWTSNAVTSVAYPSSRTSYETTAQSGSSEESSFLSSLSPELSSLSTSTLLSSTFSSTVTFEESVTPTGNSKMTSKSNLPTTIIETSTSPNASSKNSLKPTLHTTVTEISAPSTKIPKQQSKSTIHSFSTVVSTSADIISKESSKLTAHTAIITEIPTSPAKIKSTTSGHTMPSTFGKSVFVSNSTSIHSEATALPSSSDQTITPTTFITTPTEGIIPSNGTQMQNGNGNGTDSDDSATVILLTSVLAFLAVVIFVLFGTLLLRKRRAKRFQGQILQPDDDIL